MLRYLTAGESHGRGLTAVVEGFPAGLVVIADAVNHDLARRQVGYGRGARMKIEQDSIQILSGVRHGKTLGSPIALFIENRDWANWERAMSEGPVSLSKTDRVTRPRPGHADLAGAVKYDHRDVRNVLERSSARETAARVAVGAVARLFLKEFGVEVLSHVVEIGGTRIQTDKPVSHSKVKRLAEKSDLRCVDAAAAQRMRRRIDRALREGDSLGGVFEVIARGVPVGLGSHVQYDRKIDGRLAGALMSIQAIKGVEVGLGFEAARRAGSEVHDEISHSRARGFYRRTNRGGGIEGGMTNGEDIVVRAAMKPIPTLKKPLRSVDIVTKKKLPASIERSDVCAVPAAGVIAEAVVSFELARAMLEKFGGDSLAETLRNYRGYVNHVRKF